MTEDEMNLDMLVAELEQENRLLRARNERLMAEAQASNFERTADWLKACGKVPGPAALSVQIGCHLEEFIEFLMCVDFDSTEDAESLERSVTDLQRVANGLKKGLVMAGINPSDRIEALDALCDSEVTGNGVAYLAKMDKHGADRAVLDSNDAKLVDGKPVFVEGTTKIGKPLGWKAPDLSGFV
jgi:predicted HAD superfamily Cof-like phosphohydrolase